MSESVIALITELLKNDRFCSTVQNRELAKNDDGHAASFWPLTFLCNRPIFSIFATVAAGPTTFLLCQLGTQKRKLFCTQPEK